MTKGHRVFEVERQSFEMIAAARQADALPIDQRVAKVFISYSRKDGGFAEYLVSALSDRHFSAYLDSKDIAPGEAWQQRLGKLILAADAVVFVLSPDAARSPICRWEVGEATRLHKRVLPVVHRQTELTAIPQELAELNFIDMSKPDDRKVAVLAEAISTDIEWVREHTRIGERAEQWSAANRRNSELLRGSALESAERWLAAQPKAGGRPSVLHREFIAASRQGATRRLRFGLAGARPMFFLLSRSRAARRCIRSAASHLRLFVPHTESYSLKPVSRQEFNGLLVDARQTGDKCESAIVKDNYSKITHGKAEQTVSVRTRNVNAVIVFISFRREADSENTSWRVPRGCDSRCDDQMHARAEKRGSQSISNNTDAGP